MSTPRLLQSDQSGSLSRSSCCDAVAQQFRFLSHLFLHPPHHTSLTQKPPPPHSPTPHPINPSSSVLCIHWDNRRLLCWTPDQLDLLSGLSSLEIMTSFPAFPSFRLPPRPPRVPLRQMCCSCVVVGHQGVPGLTDGTLLRSAFKEKTIKCKGEIRGSRPLDPVRAKQFYRIKILHHPLYRQIQ